jgi:prepilin-type N-terminal cleavage/methylation domain-containing protein
MRAPRHHRGFTLLELLLVIALLLTAAALVYPPMVDRMDDRAFESGAEIVVNQLLLARAHARTTGDPVEVLYLPEPARVEARLFDPARQIDDEGILETFRERSADGPTAPSSEVSEDAVPEDWALRPLPRDMWIDTRSEDDTGSEDDRGMRVVRLAVFLPDGSALAGEVALVGDDDDRSGRLTVNPWTGLPAFERGAGAPDEEVEEEEEEEPEADEQEIKDFEAESPPPSPEPEEPEEEPGEEPEEEPEEP